MKFLKSEKGEFTVEATLVFSIAFMTIVLMTYLGVVMYQHVHLQSITDRIASRGAMMYATRTTDMNTGFKSEDSFWQCDPYRYIFEGSYKGTAETSITNSLNEALGIGNVALKSPGDDADAFVELGLFSRKVKVIGNRSFNVPFVSVFGMDNSFFDLDVESTAQIMDMPETIRNVDFVCDMLLRIDGVENAVSKVGELKENLNEFIQKIE